MGSRFIVFVFVKAPIPGRVKTRLAASLGRVEAARLYQSLAHRIVKRVGAGGYRTVVYFDPPSAEADVRAWLGHGREYLPQPEGDLGERLRQAFARGFEEADWVSVVGTDIPDLDRAAVERAFELVSGSEGPDAVFGPAIDGGYYLVALSRAAPGLFEGIAWSTPAVLEESLRRADALGLTVGLLDPLADIDRAEDLPDELSVQLLLESPKPPQDRDDPGEQDDPGERVGDEDVPEVAHLEPGRPGRLRGEIDRHRPEERGHGRGREEPPEPDRSPDGPPSETQLQHVDTLRGSKGPAHRVSPPQMRDVPPSTRDGPPRSEGGPGPPGGSSRRGGPSSV